jgi:hypothetical protein
MKNQKDPLEGSFETDPQNLRAAETFACFGDKRAVAAMAGGMSFRWVDGEMAKGMPYLRLGARRCKFDLAEVRAWLKGQYAARRLGPVNPKSEAV